MQQLQTMKTMLLERIHQIVREEVIKDIRFFLGEVSPPSRPPLSRQPKKVMKEKRLSGKMEACLHQVKDNDLKALLKRIMLKQADTMMGQTSGKPDKKALDVNQDSFGSHS